MYYCETVTCKFVDNKKKSCSSNSNIQAYEVPSSLGNQTGTIKLLLHAKELKPSFDTTVSSVRGHSHIESSHSLSQNDATLKTYLPIILNVKMPNLPKIDVYNFIYKISVGNMIKLFFLYTFLVEKIIATFLARNFNSCNGRLHG